MLDREEHIVPVASPRERPRSETVQGMAGRNLASELDCELRFGRVDHRPILGEVGLADHLAIGGDPSVRELGGVHDLRCRPKMGLQRTCERPTLVVERSNVEGTLEPAEVRFGPRAETRCERRVESQRIELHHPVPERSARPDGPDSTRAILGHHAKPAHAFSDLPFVSAIGATEVVEVPVDELEAIVTSDPLLGEIILRPYLIRRSLAIGAGAGLRIVGSCFSPQTRDLLDFIARNRLPHRLVDLDEDEKAERLVRQLGATVADFPLVILGLIWLDPLTQAAAAGFGAG